MYTILHECTRQPHRHIEVYLGLFVEVMAGLGLCFVALCSLVFSLRKIRWEQKLRRRLQVLLYNFCDEGQAANRD